ncbi:MAG: transporter substrate-binding domain-containing protein [Pseudomonadota bacterium]
MRHGIKAAAMTITAAISIAAIPSPAFVQSGDLPQFWDPGYVTAKPPLDGLLRLRFITTLDYPPFNFADENRKPTGFNVDLARAICENLRIETRCEIQAVPWDELQPALDANRAEAIIAGYDVTPEFRAKYQLSQPYFRFPARFIGRTNTADGVAPEIALTDLMRPNTRIGVLQESAHAAYLEAFFPRANVIQFPNAAPLYVALKDQEVDYLFGDGVSFSFWLASRASDGCCRLVAEPILDTQFFGHGMVVAVRFNEDALHASINAALKELEATGVVEELFVRYFPISPFGP